MTSSGATELDERALSSFRHVLWSEWLKLITLRSSVLALAALAGIGIALAAGYSFLAGEEFKSPSGASPFDPTDPAGTALFGVQIAQVAIMTLGVLLMTGEYATGMIHSSLAAVPRRSRLLAAKAVVFAGVTLVVGTLTGLGMFLLGQGVLAIQGAPSTTLGQPHVLRAVLGVGAYLVLVGLLGLAVGTLVRSTAAGISLMFVGILVLPQMVGALPESLASPLQRNWPSVAGFQITQVERDPAMLAPWTGLALMGAFVAAALLVAGRTFRALDP